MTKNSKIKLQQKKEEQNPKNCIKQLNKFKVQGSSDGKILKAIVLLHMQYKQSNEQKKLEIRSRVLLIADR